MRNKIKQRVNEILDDNGIFEAPIDLMSICNREGIKVFNMDLDSDISGYIIIRKEKVEKYDSNKMIFLNSNHSKNRQIFTIAHELGHYFLHKDNEEYFALRCDNENNNQKLEKEANYFASILLMPDDLLRKEIRWYGSRVLGFSIDSLIYHLCSKFNVSYDACRIRLYKEGMI